MTVLKSAGEKSASASPWWSKPVTTVTRVLWADDDAMLRAVGRMMLTRAGYAVTCVCDGVEARDELLRMSDNYEVLITDHDMPRLNGLELVRQVRAAGFQGGMIVISGSIDVRLAVEYRLAGVAAILAKPIRTESLLPAVEQARGR